MEMLIIKTLEFLKGQSLQVAIVFTAVLILTWLLRNRSAHIRYLLWLLVAIKCLTPPLVIFSVPVLPAEMVSAVTPMQSPDIKHQPMPTASQQPQNTKIPITQVEVQPQPQVSIENRESKIVNPLMARLNLTPTNILLSLWAAGAACYLLWALGKAVRLGMQLRQIRRPLPAQLMIEQIEMLARLWNHPGGFNVWLLDGINQPFVWGLWRGAIYLPTRFQSIQTDKQKAIVIHEMAHVVRMDAFVNLIQILIQGVFWFHPLVWLANRAIRQEREKCCDEIAVARLGAAPREYGSAIVDTLLHEVESTMTIPTLAVAGPVKNIEDRIKTIMQPGRQFFRRPSTIALLIIGVLAAFVVPTTIALTQKITPPDYTLSGIVTDAQTGKPIIGAIVFDDGYGPEPYQKGITDDSGKFEYKSWNEEHNVAARADGYQQQMMTFTTFPFDNSKNLNFKLQPGQKTDVKVEIEKPEVASRETEAKQEVPLDKTLRQTVTFKKDMPFTDALDMLSKVYKVNIIPSQKVANSRSIVGVTTLYDVNFEQILKAICGTTHTYEINDNFIYVYTKEEYQAQSRITHGNWKDTHQALDLATGKMVEYIADQYKETIDQIDYLKRLGKGDLLYDSSAGCLIVLRKGYASLWDGKATSPINLNYQVDRYLKAYHIPDPPYRLLVTVAEGEKYDVRILRKVASNAIEIEYCPAEKPNVKIETPSAMVPVEALSKREKDRLAAMGQMRQAALGCILFADDNNGRLPTLLEQIKPYLKEAAVPLDKIELLQTGQKWNEIKKPESTALLRMVLDGGKNGSIAAFADGHAEYFSPERMNPQASTLEFRVVPEIGKDISKSDLQKYKETLQTQGPDGNCEGYKWVAAGTAEKASWYNALPNHRYKDIPYILLCDQPDKRMLADGTWGLQRVAVDSMNQLKPSITAEFDDVGAPLFEALTQQNIKKKLAIVIDGQAISAPQIITAIQKKVLISGNFTNKEIANLVQALVVGMPSQNPKKEPSVESASTLEFRVVPEIGKDITESDLKKYKEILEAEGPNGICDGYKWVAANTSDNASWYNALPNNRYKDAVYVLLCNQPDKRMLADGTWGLQKVSAENASQYGLSIFAEFDDQGASLFKSLTKQNIGKAIAIIIDGKAISAPRVMSTISKQAAITGNFTNEEVANLVQALIKGMPPRGSKQKAGVKAEVEKSSADPKFIATLPNGVTVELIGICKDPLQDNQEWWLPNGSIYATPQYEKPQKKSWTNPFFGYLVKITPSDEISFDGSNSSGCPEMTFKSEDKIVVAGGWMKPSEKCPDSIDIEMKIASGEWQQNNITSNNKIYPDFVRLPGKDSGISLSGLRSNPDTKLILKTLLEVTTKEQDLDVRLVAQLKNNEKIFSEWNSKKPFGELLQYELGFRCNIDQIETISVQYRWFQKVIFKNVSLRPGQKTDVKIETTHNTVSKSFDLTSPAGFVSAHFERWKTEIQNNYLLLDYEIKQEYVLKGQTGAVAYVWFKTTLKDVKSNQTKPFEAVYFLYRWHTDQWEGIFNTDGTNSVETEEQMNIYRQKWCPDYLKQIEEGYTRVGGTPLPTPAQTSSPFTTVLPNGVTAELVGVCDYPSKDKQWWQPNGSPLEQKIVTQDHNRYEDKNKAYEIAYRIFLPLGVTMDMLPKTKGSTAQSGLVVKSSAEMKAYRTHLDLWGNTTDISFPIAAGSWKTLGTTDGDGMVNRVVGKSKLMFSPAVGSQGKFTLTVTDDLQEFDDYRLIAIDKQGNIHTGSRSWSSVDNLRQNTFTFTNLDSAAVDRYEFQSRPFVNIQFKNVSLKPGKKTDVKIEIPAELKTDKTYDEAFRKAIEVIEKRENWPQTPEAVVKAYWAARAKKDYDETRILWPGSSLWDVQIFQKDPDVKYFFGPASKDGSEVPYAAEDYYKQSGSYNLAMRLSTMDTAYGKRYYIRSGN